MKIIIKDKFSLAHAVKVVGGCLTPRGYYYQLRTIFRLMGAAALQKYIGSLGGIGTSGVGSSSSYTPKDLNKEVIPEKVKVKVLSL